MSVGVKSWLPARLSSVSPRNLLSSRGGAGRTPVQEGGDDVVRTRSLVGYLRTPDNQLCDVECGPV